MEDDLDREVDLDADPDRDLDRGEELAINADAWQGMEARELGGRRVVCAEEASVRKESEPHAARSCDRDTGGAIGVGVGLRALAVQSRASHAVRQEKARRTFLI